MTSPRSLPKTYSRIISVIFLLALPVSAQITAVDDGSAGSPFASTNEDALLDTSGGASVTANDTGTFTVLGSDATSAAGAPVTVNADGTFTYDPAGSGTAQALGVGQSLEDTFGYTVVETTTPTAGVTGELNPSAGVNDLAWTVLPATKTPAAGAPSIFTTVYDYAGTSTASTRGPFTDSSWQTSPVSLEFWVKQDTLENCTLWETGGSGTGSGVYLTDTGLVKWAVKTSGTQTILDSTASMTAGSWHQIVVTLDTSSGTSTLYLDGSPAGTTTAAGNTNWSGGNGAGLGGVNSDAGGDSSNPGNLDTWRNPFNGELGLFRFYSGTILDTAAVGVNRDSVISPAVDGATVTVGVTGLNDPPAAFADVLNDGPFEDATFTSTVDLTANDGVVQFDGTGADILVLNYEAAQSAGSGVWENLGPQGGSLADWVLGTGVTLNGSVTSTHDRITAAYEWDGTTNATALYGGAGDSISEILGASVDQTDSTFEFWMKLAAADLGQISTIFETGGGTGFGAIIDNGVLKAATETDGAGGGGSTVSYDLQADPRNLVGGDPTSEFFQVAVAIRPGGGGLTLFVNGEQVDQTTSATNNDWDGGDGSGLGRFGGTNHGGFQSPAADTDYDTYFNGSMAIVRLYNTSLSLLQVRGNYEAISKGTDIDGDSIVAEGVIDGTDTFVAIGNPATLASGALVTMTSATGGFTYDPNGQFESLGSGQTATDTFTYQVGDGNGGTGTAEVTVAIKGKNDAVADTLAASEALVTVFTANQLVGNDDHTLATSDAFQSLDAIDASGGTWPNTGSGGSAFDVTVTGGTVISPPDLESNFGGVGAAYQNVAGSFASVQSIATADATFEIWFQPEPLQTGKMLLLEGGGNGNGMSIVFDADANEVVFTVDGGNDTLDRIQATATGVVAGEFNQLIAVYDKDNPTVEDSLTLYLNNNPTAAFNTTPAGSDTNTLGTADQWSGTDLSGIGAVTGSAALNESISPFIGQISISRTYARKLSTTEMAANYDAVKQPIQGIVGGSPFTTSLGALVTLLADGSVEYDGTGITPDIPVGNVVTDSFQYIISDGEGGTSTATVTVNVTGVDNSFLAVDDDVTIGESDGPTTFTVLGNDSYTTATVELQSLESDFLANFGAGAAVNDPADFSGTTGWSYLWNAPTDWDLAGAPVSDDASTGGFGSSAAYELLRWTGTYWSPDGDEDNFNNDPASFTKLQAGGSGHPGLGATQAGATTIANDKARGPIAAYTVPGAGIYGLANSSLSKASTSGDSISAVVYVNDDPKLTVPVAPGSLGDFDINLGTLAANDVIYVGVSPDDTGSSDAFTWDFDVVQLPATDSGIIDIIGTVSTDGTTVTYDPGTAFDALKAGQTVEETLTYTITDAGSTSTATLTITVQGENDAPMGVADANETPANIPVSGTVLGNDTDVDAGDTATLVVGLVEGSAGNVGSAVTLTSGATVTMQSDGSYVFDPSGASYGVGAGASTTDSFTYTVQDEDALNAASPTTVTITIWGVPANGQAAAANATQTVRYASGATNVAIDPAIVASDANDGLAATSAAKFTFDGSTTVFADASPDADADFTQTDPVDADGFSYAVVFTPTAADVADGARVAACHFGGTSNGNGLYLSDGIPHFVAKMNGANNVGPATLSDPDWGADEGVCVPLTAAKLPAGQPTEIALIFDLDQLIYTVNGGPITVQPLPNRDGRSNWAGDNTVDLGTAGSDGSRGGLVEAVGSPLESSTYTALGGAVNAMRYWNVSAPSAIVPDPEILVTTLTINPAEGALSVPAGASFDGTTWSYSGTPGQANVQLEALEFLPNGTAPVDVAVDVRDGLENGTTAVTGTLTFDVYTIIEEWRVDNGLAFDGSGADQGDTEDLDTDTIVNILEFAFGMDPNSPDATALVYDPNTMTVTSRGLPDVHAEFAGGGGLDFTARFLQRTDADQAGSVSYTVEFSGDLQSWEAGAATPTVVANDGEYDLVEVPYPLFVNGKKARFFRVTVTAL